MAAPEIPNLKSLLAQRRGGLHARGRGPRAPISHETSEAAKDDAVKGTDQDAAGSRVSCVELGYLDDPYAKVFAAQQTVRRLPLLNRGTYVRTTGLDQLIHQFLTTAPGSPKQIISLGAGTDTRYFRLLSAYPSLNLTYHEIDFPCNTSSKIAAIQRSPAILSLLSHPPTISTDGTSLSTPTYNITALDLRTLASPTPPPLPNLNPSTPTLLLSECCLVYLPPTTASDILTTLTTHHLSPTTPCALVLYEPVRPHDAFGRTMVSNLKSRNIHLHTLATYPDLASQITRLKTAGFDAGQGGVDTGFVWREWVSEAEKERVGALEMLDEFEELGLLLGHYCVCWGWRDRGGEEKDMVFSEAWSGVKAQVGGPAGEGA
ncbi:leucine carboxyl methyltransferase [Mytilinidion resinicola]|uniref:Leucine carboxyl methyltransferase 1 n=1 Tax=Mytilinidion resinicola TaxID=574789 RepID=A0A6A6YG40_9PEZI|nr:leucine carboxyl methyltransferase [Mytilinidion resinicola]KAF2807771.1 leucine carboxyl methyltransferase [Mytilinidion resinicola]